MEVGSITGSAKSKNDVPLASSIPEGAASLESLLCTEELQQRRSQSPDQGKENAALVSLPSALAEPRPTIFAILAETILRVTGSDSSGLSLLTSEGGKSTSAAGRRAISFPVETSLIVFSRRQTARDDAH